MNLPKALAALLCAAAAAADHANDRPYQSARTAMA